MSHARASRPSPSCSLAPAWAACRLATMIAAMIAPMIAPMIAMGAALLTAPSASHASGLSTPLVGSPWSSVVTQDPAAVYFNPSLLAGVEGLKLQLGGSFVWAQASYRREYRATYQRADSLEFKLPLSAGAVDASKTGWASPLGVTIALPLGSAFASYGITDDLALGLGVYATDGATLRAPDDGPQRFQVQEALILALHLTPSVAYRVTPWLSVGAGLNLVYGSMSLRQVVDLAGTDMLGDAFANPPLNQPNDFGADATPAVRELDVMARLATLTTHAFGVRFNAGVTVRPAKGWTIGAAYQHGVGLVFKGDAYLDMNHDFFTGDLAAKGLEYPPVVHGTAYIELPLPASVRLGVGWEVTERDQLQLAVGWVGWSALKSIDVTLKSPDLAQPKLGMGPVTEISLPKNDMDTVEVDALYVRDVTPALRLGGRLGYQSSATPDETMDLSGIDGHRLTGGIMADYRVGGSVRLGAHVLVQQVLPRRVTASLYDRGNGEYALTMLVLGGTMDIAL